MPARFYSRHHLLLEVKYKMVRRLAGYYQGSGGAWHSKSAATCRAVTQLASGLCSGWMSSRFEQATCCLRSACVHMSTAARVKVKSMSFVRAHVVQLCLRADGSTCGELRQCCGCMQMRIAQGRSRQMLRVMGTFNQLAGLQQVHSCAAALCLFRAERSLLHAGLAHQQGYAAADSLLSIASGQSSAAIVDDCDGG